MSEREMTFYLAHVERRVLTGLARRLPGWVLPDHLSGLGLVAAAGIGAAYAASALHPAWLWVASGFLVLQWFGDSLDGTLARVRRIERPRYGYYLDHGLDALSTALIGIGIGLSPFVAFDLALGLVVVYLMLSVNVYLETNVFGVFRMAYGRFGPTEGRIALIAGNSILAATGGAAAVTGANVAAGALGIAMAAALGVRFARNLRRLARLEPAGRSSVEPRPNRETTVPAATPG